MFRTRNLLTVFALLQLVALPSVTANPECADGTCTIDSDGNTLLQGSASTEAKLQHSAVTKTKTSEDNGAPEAAASAHGMQTLGEKKSRHLESLLMMTNATSMLAGIQEMARSGETPAYDQLQQAKAFLEGMSAILQATREAAATATTDALAAVQLCNTQWDTHFANIQAEFNMTVTGPTSQRSAHKQCRLDEKAKYHFNLTNSDSPCLKLGTILHDIKQDSFALADFMKVLGQRSDLVNYVNNFVQELTLKAATMTTLDASCTVKEGELADTKRECNGKQTEFQQGFCAIKTKLEEHSDGLDECYETSVAAYNKHVTDTQNLVVKWNIEEVTLQKILCFFDVWLADADTADKDTAGNHRSQVNQTGKFDACNALSESHEAVDYGQVDSKAVVNLTIVSNHPGQPGFITEENGFFPDFHESVVACMEATTTAKPTTQAPTTADPTTLPEASQCTNTRDNGQGASCAAQLSVGSSCENRLSWKDCDMACNLCACSTASGVTNQHCSGHGTCSASCSQTTCTGASCQCESGWTGAKCEQQA